MTTQPKAASATTAIAHARTPHGALLGAILTALTLTLAPSPADAANRCLSGTYAVEDTPFLPLPDDGARDVIVTRDGNISIAGCETVRARFRERDDSVRVVKRWASCEGIAGPVKLRLTLDLDCQTVKGVLIIGDLADGGTRKRFRATSIAPKPEVAVDPAVTPSVDAIPPIAPGQGIVGGDEDRPVAALATATGPKTDFVANEIIVYTDDLTARDELIARLNGSLVKTIAPADYGLHEVVARHVVRIDPSAVDVTRVIADLKSLNPERELQLRVSSPEALATVAATASEATGGLQVGLNVVGTAETYQNRTITDGIGNVFTDPKLRGRCTPGVDGPCTEPGGAMLNTGVTEAWRALDKAGRLGNKVDLGIIDGGFSTQNTDLPPFSHDLSTGRLNAENPMKCGGNECKWHGTNVAQILAAVPNNNTGTAGVAGPVVGKLVTATISSDIATTTESLLKTYFAGARIINMSFAFKTPALGTIVTDLHGFQDLTRGLRGRGILLVAAAGNDGLNVDHEHCALFACWEETWHAPCENDGVFCIGGTDDNGWRAASSNYGSSVDFWGPYTINAGPVPGVGFGPINGTSGTAPFIAGTAALVWAANPGLSADDVERILIETAHPTPDPVVGRYVNAYGAVIRALGGTPPEMTRITVTQEATGSLFGSPAIRMAAQVSDPDGAPTVYWSSDLDGALGTGNPFTTRLKRGRHTITAVAVDAQGFRSAALATTLEVSYATVHPDLRIETPAMWAEFAPNQPFVLELSGRDYNQGYGLPVSQNVYWYLTDHLGNLTTLLGRGSRVVTRLSTPGIASLRALYDYDNGQQYQVYSLGVYILSAAENPTFTPPAVLITRPANNDVDALVISNGTAFLDVAGYGVDREEPGVVIDGRDNPFRTYWMTDRGDIAGQTTLWFGSSQRLALLHDPRDGNEPTLHQLRLFVQDRNGIEGASPVLRVWVLPPTIR